MSHINHGVDGCEGRVSWITWRVRVWRGEIGLISTAVCVWSAVVRRSVQTVAKPVVREIVEDDEFVGRFEAIDEVDVRARVGGYLEKVHFTDGAIVPEGALLFTIDQRPFKTAVAEAEANLKIAAAEVDYTKRQRSEEYTSVLQSLMRITYAVFCLKK